MAVKTVTATINGVTHNLTYNASSGKWEASLTAPGTTSYTQSGHYYSVSITATDDAGNSSSADAAHPTLGQSLRLFVKETVKPTIVITAPATGAYVTTGRPTITAEVKDSGSGVNPDSISAKIDSGPAVTGTAISKTAIAGGYRITYLPTSTLADGSHTVTIQASDFDGNAAVAGTSSFQVDTIAPTLNITSPADGLVTNQVALTIVGTTSDTTSGPVAVTVKVNSGSAQTVTVNSNGSFTKSVTLAEGLNTIVVTASDKAGKTTSVTRRVTLNTSAPKITAVKLTPTAVNTGTIYKIEVTVG